MLFLRPSEAAPDSADPEPGAALQDLVADVGAAMASGQLATGDPFTAGLALWSTVHGVAALGNANPTLPAGLARSVAELAQSAVLRGLAVPGELEDQ